jgi:hypothetical protein
MAGKPTGFRRGGVFANDRQLIAYGGAVHSFTDWNAGNDNTKGAAYTRGLTGARGRR